MEVALHLDITRRVISKFHLLLLKRGKTVHKKTHFNKLAQLSLFRALDQLDHSHLCDKIRQVASGYRTQIDGLHQKLRMA